MVTEKLPILLICFRRPETTKRVLAAIREYRPRVLYVACDGPRPGVGDEEAKVALVRDLVADEVDWPCRLETRYREKNLGCKEGVIDAVDWFFENEPEGIVLEDDCLPSQGFFVFCEKMLQFYRDDLRVALACGYNKSGDWPIEDPYFFSQLGGIWGWASWRRVWRNNDPTMSLLSRLERIGFFKKQFGPELGKMRLNDLKRVQRDSIDTWDYQFGLSRHIQNGLTAFPSKNLIQNIGFGSGATHTKGDSTESVQLFEFSSEVEKLPYVFPDRDFDRFLYGLAPEKKRKGWFE